MSFEVLITVAPPEADTWPPPRDEFMAWAASLGVLVRSMGGSRTLDVYSREHQRAQVNIWTDGGHPATWAAALEYIGQRVEALESAGYDVSGVEVIPGNHFVAIG